MNADSVRRDRRCGFWACRGVCGGGGRLPRDPSCSLRVRDELTGRAAARAIEELRSGHRAMRAAASAASGGRVPGVQSGSLQVRGTGPPPFRPTAEAPTAVRESKAALGDDGAEGDSSEAGTTLLVRHRQEGRLRVGDCRGGRHLRAGHHVACRQGECAGFRGGHHAVGRRRARDGLGGAHHVAARSCLRAGRAGVRVRDCAARQKRR